ncbi:murein transglycosylase [Exophiala aquamarina CBS 119918]|uniref:Probable glucan endo-1,3-beta-glucosidase eglC n=1 Tax=Exophiala aquamarina CBS 119918 TaxID=1182545 RepID=A0A072PEB4_9EURO|nr:murein transglycosylase [Exophiala aquamarina CBS 119918]KEF58112.1 murein transglycosylase [Exophiala aquamarina CBS 119918]
MKTAILAALAAAPSVLAAVHGFNYASQGQSYETFAAQFKIAASLEGASDFTSARLYTMIQEGTQNTPISAIQAAIETKTTLLLGLWASVDQTAFSNELAALKSAIDQYGSDFADLVTGISVGSEDLYRISTIGIAADSGVGQSPDVLVDYIGQVRKAVQGTSLGSKPIGHVDTWNVYVNQSNAELVSACDWLGLDEYPYFQTTDTNNIENAGSLFFEAYDKVSAVAGGRPIWITEAGWPTSGPTSHLAIASTDNAESFWQDVSCELQRRNIDFWWYILADGGASPSFGVSENGKPLYDLSCKASAKSNSTSSTSSSSNSTATGSYGSSGSQGATSSRSGSAEPTGSSPTSGNGAPTTQGAGSTLATSTQAGNGASSIGSGAPAASFTAAASRMSGSVLGVAAGALLAVFAL